MYYLLLYDVVEDFIARRAPFRDAHLKLIRDAHERGDLLMAGAFAEPVDGAALVFTTGDRSEAERFAQDDPYVREGLVTAWRVRQWNVVVGGE
jgi:uncharacterized protein YciI